MLSLLRLKMCYLAKMVIKRAVAANNVKMNFLLEQQFQKGEMIQLTIEPANISIVQE